MKIEEIETGDYQMNYIKFNQQKSGYTPQELEVMKQEIEKKEKAQEEVFKGRRKLLKVRRLG